MRVKGGNVRRKKHKKILKATKGYRMTKNRLYKVAHEAYLHAKQYAYNHRQRRHSQMRRIWISRISSACKANNIAYKDFMHALKENKVEINKKILAHIAFTDPKTFTQIVKSVSK